MSGFIVLWVTLSLIFYYSFRQQLNASFLDELKAGASVVAGKVNINPRIVPLPHGNEQFSIIYESAEEADTLYSGENFKALKLTEKDSTFSQGNLRGIVSKSYPDNGGYLKILYALPADSIDRRIRLMLLLIFISITIGALLAGLLAYKIAGRILRPVMKVIQTANNTDIRSGSSERIVSNSADTELQELSESFNRMIERISEQSQKQSAFFASASHELRTPLSVMQTRLQVMLQSKNATGESKQFLSDQLLEVKRLAKMVNDFLLMTELQQGSMRISKQEVNFAEIIPEIIASYLQKSAEKSIKIEMVFHPEYSSFTAIADSDKLSVMLSNLLDNAIKYSPDKHHININCVENAECFHIIFSNKIRKDINPDITAIAKEFYHSKPLKGEGIGLGLWITSALAEMQDMVITAEIENDQFKAVLIINK